MFRYYCGHDRGEGQRCGYVNDWDNPRTHLSRRLHKSTAQTTYGDTIGSDTNTDIKELRSCHKLNSDGTVTQELAKNVQVLPNFHEVCDLSL